MHLMKVATQAAATDPRTGRIDMDMITTGRSTANREMEEALNLSLKELLAEVSKIRMFYFYSTLEGYHLNVCKLNLTCDSCSSFDNNVITIQRRGNRMAVSDVRTQLSEIMNISTLKQEDITEGLRTLEADGLIQFNERAQTIFVRAGVVA